MLWTGRIMSAVPVLLTLLGSVMKLAKVAPALEGMARAGFPERFAVPIGILELICVAAYVIPQTSVLGAILLTGLLGGATVTTLRIGDDGVGRPVSAGSAVARTHPTAKNVEWQARPNVAPVLGRTG
jgi:hypothetical protein